MMNFLLSKCPKCNKKPIIKFGDISDWVEHYQRPYNVFYIKCCDFFIAKAKKSHIKNNWNKNVLEYNNIRKNMKFEIFNENMDKKKEKIVFMLQQEMEEGIHLMFRKSSDDIFRSLLFINEDGSLSLDTSYFNKILYKDFDENS